MQKRVYNRKQSGLTLVVAINVFGGLIGGAIGTLMIRLFLYEELIRVIVPNEGDWRSWFLIYLVISCLFIGFMIFHALRFHRSKARIELEGDTLSEFDASAKLIARGSLRQLMDIEQVKLFKHDAYVVRFSNQQFVVIGDGYINVAELIRFVIQRSNVRPTLIEKVSIMKFSQEMVARKPIDPDQTFSPYPR